MVAPHLLRNFIEYFAMSHPSFTAKQLRAFGEWINHVVSVDAGLENAVSTCFLEHSRQVGMDRVLKPCLPSKAKGKLHP